MFPFWLPPPILGYLIVFSAGCIFTLLALGVTLILFVRYSSTSTLKGTSPKHIGPVTSKPRLSQTHAKTHKSLELDNDGEYDPDLGKVGWIRFSSEPLTIDQLYMDSSGNDTIYFLGGIGSDKKTSGGEAFAGTEVVAANHRTYLNSFSFVWKFAIYVGDAALQTSNYLVSRFTGEDLAPLPEIANESTKHREPFIAPWRDVFAVLKNDSLFLYSSDEKMTCLDVIQLSECEVSLNAPNVPDHEIYQRHLPLSLNLCEHLGSEAPRPVHLLYSLTNSDKEDWYLLLRRASLSNYSIHNNISPTSVASTAISISQIQENYICSMKKLTSSIAIDDPTSAWINAFLGRIFVGFHSNPRIKAYLIQKLSRRGTKSFDTGFLSDIVISDLNIGDSLPILSSPRLVSFSLDGDLILDLNLNYTGGIRVEAATVATISVSTLNLQPFSIPLVLAIKINHIHATIRLKIKPFHESSRVWVGLHPNLDIGIQVDPVISNRLITLNMVNQVIEKRVKDALNEFIVLPNMDDFGFWPGGGKGGFFWDGADETVEVETTVSDGGDKLPEPTSSTISDPVRASEGTQERDKKAANETPELFSTERLNPNATVPVGFLPALPEKPKVLTGGIVIDEPATDSDDAILYAAFKQQAQSMKLSVVGGPLEATIQQPSASQRSNDESETDSIYAQDYFENHASSFDDLDPDDIRATEKNFTSRKSAFEFAGRIAELAGKKSREYRVKQITRTLARTALLAADIGLSYLGYRRVEVEPVKSKMATTLPESMSSFGLKSRRGPLLIRNRSPVPSIPDSVDFYEENDSDSTFDRAMSNSTSSSSMESKTYKTMYTSKPVGLSTKSSILDILGIEIKTSSPVVERKNMKLSLWRKSKSRDTIETYRHEVSTAVESKPSLRIQSDPTLSAQLQFYPHTDASTSMNLKFSSYDDRNSDADAPHNYSRTSSKPQSLSKVSVVGDISVRNSCAIISCPDVSGHDEILAPASSLRTEVMADLLLVIQPNAGFINSDNYYDLMESEYSASRYSAIDSNEKNSDEEPVEPMEPVCSYFGDEYEKRAVE